MAEKVKEKLQKLKQKKLQNLMESFAKYDADGNGKISPDKLKEGLRKKEIAFNDQMFHILDVDGDGMITLAEFLKAFSLEHKWSLKTKQI